MPSVQDNLKVIQKEKDMKKRKDAYQNLGDQVKYEEDLKELQNVWKKEKEQKKLEETYKEALNKIEKRVSELKSSSQPTKQPLVQPVKSPPAQPAKSPPAQPAKSPPAQPAKSPPAQSTKQIPPGQPQGKHGSKYKKSKSQGQHKPKSQPITNDQRKIILKKVRTRYKDIDLAKLTKLLGFNDVMQLERFLLELPANYPLKITANKVLIIEQPNQQKLQEHKKQESQK